MSAEYFPGRLKELRESAGLTQKELADKAGFTKDGISQWESGRRAPAWPHVLALAKVLGVALEAFTVKPATQGRPGPGRPAKAKPKTAKAKKPRGRLNKGK